MQVKEQLARVRVCHILRRAWRRGRETLLLEAERAIRLLQSAGLSAQAALDIVRVTIQVVRDAIRAERASLIVEAI